MPTTLGTNFTAKHFVLMKFKCSVLEDSNNITAPGTVPCVHTQNRKLEAIYPKVEEPLFYVTFKKLSSFESITLLPCKTKAPN